MISPITIDGQLVTPNDIKYDATGVHIGSMYRPSNNPRLEFAKVLGMFKDDSRMEWLKNSSVRNNTVIGNYCSVGSFCTIGDDGFGYEQGVKIPHLGLVRIGNNVTIRNNVCIDRAVIGETVIGDNSCIDNLVHVAHGVQIGRNCIIVAGVVLGGSCIIGDNTFIGMNASIKNKVRIGAGCIIGAGTVVLKDVPDGETWVGNPGRRLVK